MPTTASPAATPAVNGSKVRDATIKAMTKQERINRRLELVPGLTGKALNIWIQTGKGSREQIADARLEQDLTNAHNAAHEAETQENDMIDTATKTTQSARKRQGSTTRTQDRAAAKPTGLTAATVARDADIDPRKFRAFLRAEGIDRTFATKAKAAAAVKRFVKASA